MGWEGGGWGGDGYVFALAIAFTSFFMQCKGVWNCIGSRAVNLYIVTREVFRCRHPDVSQTT